MPCNAIAVTSARVPLELAQELDRLGMDVVEGGIVALLTQQFSHLGTPQVQRGVALRIYLGRARIDISSNWLVTVSGRGPLGEIRDAVGGLVNGLAGLALQKRVTQEIAAGGYRITDRTRAPNGALVLGVEL